MMIDSNQVGIAGKAISEFKHSHDVFGEGFYLLNVEVERLSKVWDVIPIMVSERLVDVNQDIMGRFINVSGHFRSYNSYDYESSKRRLVLSVFAREITIDNEEGDRQGQNSILLDGYICKPPIYRKTPQGREIADIILAVNRPYEKSDYIPCICWGRNARFAGSLSVGENIQVRGRIQSREYGKVINDMVEKKTAIEVSVSKIERFVDINENIG